MMKYLSRSEMSSQYSLYHKLSLFVLRMLPPDCRVAYRSRHHFNDDSFGVQSMCG